VSHELPKTAEDPQSDGDYEADKVPRHGHGGVTPTIFSWNQEKDPEATPAERDSSRSVQTAGLRVQVGWVSRSGSGAVADQAKAG
jgi:hypothetical protein